jgi:hypothetical protein
LAAISYSSDSVVRNIPLSSVYRLPWDSNGDGQSRDVAYAENEWIVSGVEEVKVVSSVAVDALRFDVRRQADLQGHLTRQHRLPIAIALYDPFSGSEISSLTNVSTMKMKIVGVLGTRKMAWPSRSGLSVKIACRRNHRAMSKRNRNHQRIE